MCGIVIWDIIFVLDAQQSIAAMLQYWLKGDGQEDLNDMQSFLKYAPNKSCKNHIQLNSSSFSTAVPLCLHRILF